MFFPVECTSEVLQKFDRYLEPTFFHSTRFEMEKRIPHLQFKLFCYEANDSIYWYGYKDNKFIEPHIIFLCQSYFNTVHFLDGFKQFEQAMELFSPPKNMLLVAEENMAHVVMEYITTNHIPLDFQEYPTIEFVVLPEQERIVMEMSAKKLPDGYDIRNANPDDYEFITSKWQHATKGDVENTRQKLILFPSSCLYVRGKAVGFNMVDTGGTLNNLFVMEEYRNQGFGKEIQLDLMKKLIGDGITVYKHVEISNKHVVNFTKNLPFWTDEKQGRRRINQDTFIFTIWLDKTLDVVGYPIHAKMNNFTLLFLLWSEVLRFGIGTFWSLNDSKFYLFVGNKLLGSERLLSQTIVNL